MKKARIHWSADSVAQSKSTNTDGTWWLDTGKGSDHTRLTWSKGHSILTQPMQLPMTEHPGAGKYKKYNILKHFHIRDTLKEAHERREKVWKKKDY